MSAENRHPTPFVNRIVTGDCLDVLATLPAGSVDLVATAPPWTLQATQQSAAPNAIPKMA
jgi:hypothetical protein